MATSSIGKPVVLTKETGRRMADICAKPAKKATSTGRPLKLSTAPIADERWDVMAEEYENGT